MRLKDLTVVVVLTFLLPALSDLSAERVQAQMMAPAWTPIARVNPQKPYRVQLVNQTTEALEFASTTNEFPPRRLQAGTSTSLNQLPMPIYLLISPVNSNLNVRYLVSSNHQNVITVSIQPLAEGRVGHSTLNIQNNGGVYIY